MHQHKIKFLLGLLSIVLFSIDSYAQVAERDKHPDIRVLIDVSGSMKQNDPKNLRIPALKLLVKLLPRDSVAGIWLFDEEAKSLIPARKIDENWKDKALSLSTKINSRGLFTDIEQAVEQSTKSWTAPKPREQRSLILLTDGVVDISKNPEESRQSRRRILDNLLPKLQQNAVKIHTIALSKNADHELLQKLSFATDGWNESVATADQLQRVFLKILKKAAPQPSLPLLGNEFNVDESVQEFSLLVFRKSGARATKLIAPDNSEITQQSTSENIKWLHEESYDLITVQKPMPGQWRFVGDVDPDNEVMIVTDLKLKTTELPNYVYQKEPLEILVSLTDKDTIITRDDFLNLVTVTLRQTDDLDLQWEWLIAGASAAKGTYIQKIDDSLTPGKHTFTVIADGKTFQRQVEQTVIVIETPIKVELTEDTTTEPPGLVINVTPDKNIIDPVTLQVNASLTDSTGKKEFLTAVVKNDIQTFSLGIPDADKRIVVNFDVSAITLRGDPITPVLKPLILDGKKPAEIPDNKAIEPEENNKLEEVTDNASGKEPEQPLEERSNETINWLVTSSVAAAINLVILIGGFFAYRFFKKQDLKNKAQLLDRLTP